MILCLLPAKQFLAFLLKYKELHKMHYYEIWNSIRANIAEIRGVDKTLQLQILKKCGHILLSCKSSVYKTFLVFRILVQGFGGLSVNTYEGQQTRQTTITQTYAHLSC